MKHQALFSLKNKSKKITVSSAAIFTWHFKGVKYCCKECKTTKSSIHHLSYFIIISVEYTLLYT